MLPQRLEPLETGSCGAESITKQSGVFRLRKRKGPEVFVIREVKVFMFQKISCEAVTFGSRSSWIRPLAKHTEKRIEPIQNIAKALPHLPRHRALPPPPLRTPNEAFLLRGVRVSFGRRRPVGPARVLGVVLGVLFHLRRRAVECGRRAENWAEFV